MIKHLDEIKAEVKILEGTRDILKARSGMVDGELAQIEKNLGI